MHPDLPLMVDRVESYAIFMLDPTGVIASWNLGAQRINGYTPDEIIGRHFSVFYPPQAIAQDRPAWELRTALQNGTVEDEGWRVRKDGTYFWASVVITALLDAEGTHRGFTKIVRDITERRNIESLLEAERQRNEFLAVLAHELRNPLAPIRSSLYILAKAAKNEEAAQRAHAVAERQLRHMDELLSDMLDLGPIARGRTAIEVQPMDLAEAMACALEATLPFIEERGHELHVDAPRDTTWVLGDETRLRQVFINLLTNAAKYTDPGGSIWVTVKDEDGEAVARVRDSGIGIEPIMLQRVFDVFVQAERRLDHSVGGVGLGLSLVKKLVELHTGTVEAFSAGPGRGSEFVVRLPAVEAPAREGSPSNLSRMDEPPSSLRVLIVDDNVDAADSLAMLLRMDGHEVSVAYEGPSAVQRAVATHPDLVLLDIGIPKMDGYRVARELRARPETCDALIVAVTGWGRENDKRAAVEAGFDHHLVKPVDPAILTDLLNEAATRDREEQAS
jgi:PAS domain S-box-containing protein